MSTRLPDYQEALDRALGAARPLERCEQVGLIDAAGRVLAEAICADRDLPPFDRAQMDGYALAAASWSPSRAWPVAMVVSAGDPPVAAVPPGSCAAIATGAPLPRGTDTVIQHELSDRGDPVRFTVDAIERGHAVHPYGADARCGDIVVDAGTALGGHHLAIAAAVGAVKISVRSRPRAVVLTSGDEIVDPSAAPLPHQVRNSNAVLIDRLLRAAGAEPVDARHVADDPRATGGAVGAALAGAELLVTAGGISAGERDHFPGAFAAHGVVEHLRGAAIQPGRPILVGRAPAGTVVVALPGNPVSVLACGCLFLWPLVRALLGLDAALPWRRVALAEPVRPNPKRRGFRPAVLSADGASATVPRWAGSGDLAHTAPTHGLLELPVQEEEVERGEMLRFVGWPW